MRTRTIVATALLLSGCRIHHHAPQPEPPRSPARDSLFELDESRSDSLAARGPVDGAMALISDDVAYLHAGLPAVFGRDAARMIFNANQSTTPSRWQPLGGDISVDRLAAYTYGIAARARGANAPIDLSRYIAYWRRTPRTPWRIVAYAEIDGAASKKVDFASDQLIPPPPLPTRAAAVAAARLRAVDSAFSESADRKSAGTAFAETVAPTGVVFANDRLVVGPAAIRELFEASSAGTSLTWRPIYAEVAASEDLGFTIGEYTTTGRGPSGATVQRFGKYLTIWERQPKGGWKFVVEGGNPSPAHGN